MFRIKLCLILGFACWACGVSADGWTTSALYGADVRSLAIHPDQPDLVLAGTSGGHVYRSDDGGSRWLQTTLSPPFVGWVVSTLKFDPNRPGRLWAGLWGVWGGGLVAFSDDLGATWSYRKDPPGGQVYSLTLVPGEPGRLWIGTRKGVFGSSDDGLHWAHATAKLPEVEKVTSLWVDPQDPRTVFAGSWQCAYKSRDGGKTWKGLFTGMLRDSEVFSLTPVPGKPGAMWASTCGWVYYSPDAGARWQRFEQGMKTRRVPSFAVLPSGRLLAGTTSGLFRSDNQGASWQLATSDQLAVHAIGLHPARSGRVLLGTEGSGIWVSNDGGLTFERSSEAMTNVRVAALVSTGREVVAAVNHAGPASGIYSSINGGKSFQLQRAGLPTVLELAVAEGRVFAATEQGLWLRTEDYEWRPVAELAGIRIEQIEAEGRRVLARTAAGKLFERVAHDRFVEVVHRHGPAAAASLLGGALWLADQAGLYRLTAIDNHTLPTPTPVERLVALPRSLLMLGATGLHALADGASDWRHLAGAAQRVLPTGDARYAALVLSRDHAELWNESSGDWRQVPLPVPAADITAALIHDGHLLLATSGYGVVARALE